MPGSFLMLQYYLSNSTKLILHILLFWVEKTLFLNFAVSARSTMIGIKLKSLFNMSKVNDPYASMLK